MASNLFPPQVGGLQTVSDKGAQQRTMCPEAFAKSVLFFLDQELVGPRAGDRNAGPTRQEP